MNNLGWLYQNGLGVDRDYAKAKEWYERAAAAGNFDALRDLTWDALMVRDFERARSAAEQYHEHDPQALETEANRAHALMFLGRTEEARALYLSHLDQPVPYKDNRPWKTVILDGFVELRQAGLDNPLMRKIERAFSELRK